MKQVLVSWVGMHDLNCLGKPTYVEGGGKDEVECRLRALEGS
jgi:hypothetical protein